MQQRKEIGILKIFKARPMYLLFISILSVFLMTGCNGGETGHWDGDTTAPTVTLTIPADGATGASTSRNLSVTFTEAMDPLTITAASFTLTNGTTPVSGTVTYSGVTAAFNPTVNLADNTTYTATITTGAKDLAGNALASNYVWSFTTGTTPIVTLTIPADGDTGVLTNRKISATFSEPMNPLTINTTSFTLTDGTTPVSGTVTYSGVTAVFNPTVNLTDNTTYTATITTVAEDLAGSALASDYVWSFTTGTDLDGDSPTVTLTIPVNGAIDVLIDRNLSATFSEAMDPLAINNASFTLVDDAAPLVLVPGSVSYSGFTAVFNPTVNLANNTTYTATITTGAEDLAGYALATDYVWSFTTGAEPQGQLPIDLGLAAAYGTFGGSAGMTNTGIQTVIDGDIGTIATGAVDITGFEDATDSYTVTLANNGFVTGTINTCAPSDTNPVDTVKCAIATQARLDAQQAYLFLAAMPSDGVLAGNLAGTTITAGVYKNSSSVLIEGGDLTLSGTADDVWVFQIGSTLTVGGPGAAFPQSIILAGGAQAKNVFWQVGTFATINAGGGGTMVGTIIAQDGVSFSTVGNIVIVTLEGRALSLGASVTMVDTVINVPAP